MSDYEVGYRKPPKHLRFKKGVSANPKGRPKRKALAAGEIAGQIINNVLNASAEYRERGRTKKAARLELTLKTHVQRALNGDVGSAEMLLKLRAHAQRFGDTLVHKIQMSDWLPDYLGQTAEQKTREFARQVEADAPEWWKHSDFNPNSEDP
jgi:Family of unknown function (DUF5681)